MRFSEGEKLSNNRNSCIQMIQCFYRVCSIFNETAAEMKRIFSYNTNYVTIALI